MVYEFKRYLKIIFVIFLSFFCVNNTNAVYVIDKCLGSYRYFHCSDDEASDSEFIFRNGIQTIFSVRCENLENMVTRQEQALLCFIPDIRDEQQIVDLIEIAFSVFFDREKFFIKSVMLLAGTSYSPAIVNVHVLARY